MLIDAHVDSGNYSSPCMHTRRGSSTRLYMKRRHVVSEGVVSCVRSDVVGAGSSALNEIVSSSPVLRLMPTEHRKIHDGYESCAHGKTRALAARRVEITT